MHQLESAGDSQSGSPCGAQRADLPAAKVDRPRLLPVEAADAVKEGRLARAVGTNKPDDLAGFNRKRNI